MAPDTSEIANFVGDILWITLILELFFLLAIFLSFLFWLWMLADCLARTDAGFPNKNNSNEKLLWVLVIFATFILGAILYYFIVKRKTKR